MSLSLYSNRQNYTFQLETTTNVCFSVQLSVRFDWRLLEMSGRITVHNLSYNGLDFTIRNQRKLKYKKLKLGKTTVVKPAGKFGKLLQKAKTKTVRT